MEVSSDRYDFSNSSEFVVEKYTEKGRYHYQIAAIKGMCKRGGGHFAVFHCITYHV
jgi:hypothetical protein